MNDDYRPRGEGSNLPPIAEPMIQWFQAYSRGTSQVRELAQAQFQRNIDTWIAIVSQFPNPTKVAEAQMQWLTDTTADTRRLMAIGGEVMTDWLSRSREAVTRD